MARVTCPECDTRTRIPDDHDRSYVRCKECDKKIYLDDDEVEERPKRSKPRTLSKLRKPGRSSGGDGSGIISFWPLLLVFPLLMLPALAWLHRVGAMLAIGGGVVMAITGFIMAWIAASRAGIGTVGDLPFILQRIPLVHLFYQIKYAFELPKEAGMWVLLEFLGIGVAIVSGILSMQHDEPRNRFAHAAMLDPRNNAQFVGNDGFNVPRVTGDLEIDEALADLQDPDNDIALMAAEDLARMKPGVNRMIIAQRLGAQAMRPDHGVQTAVARAMNVWGTAEQVPVMIQVLDGPNNQARRAAFDFVVPFNDPRATPAIVRFFRDNPQPNISDAVRQMGASAESELLPLLNDKNLAVKRETIKLLTDVGTQKSIASLQAVATGTNAALRMPAQEAINSINARTKK